ncbi:MAG: DNA-processing protein DprA [Gammaproteobacteria bacterium]
MSVSHQTQAVLLLTAHLGKPMKGGPKPLSPTEWGRFAHWLKERGVLPETLLRQDPADLAVHCADSSITAERLQYLVGRAAALGLAMERWERAGIWVVTRADPEYPARLKKQLKTDSPPVFFGCGNRQLLNRGGVAVIGSRDASEADLAFTNEIAKEVVVQGVSIVSGGARGVDEAAMLGALEHNGTAIGVLADGLLRAATSAKYRKGLVRNNLVLVSPFNPDASFHVGNAMARNKYVYCLSDAAIVVASGNGRGGTWNGAMENLKKSWVPLWVKPQPDQTSGNAALVRQGARSFPEGRIDMTSMISGPAATTIAEPEEGAAVDDTPAGIFGHDQVRPGISKANATTQPPQTFYDYFLERLKNATWENPMTVEELRDQFDVKEAQLRAWLKRAAEDSKVRKFNGPVRYQWREPDSGQGLLFGDMTHER